MMEETLVDLESKRTLLVAINSALKQKNHVLAKQASITTSARPKQKIIFGNGMIMLIIAAMPCAFFVVHDLAFFSNNDNTEMKTTYTIENLRGDTVETWRRWNIIDSERIAVNIVNANLVSEDKIDAIKNAILSEKTVQVDDYLQHKAPKGTSSSTYYEGWQGAMDSISKSTTYHVPQSFVVLESPKGEGEITITLSTEASGDGYTGYTKDTTDNGQILKASITIYDVDNLSADQMGTIVRHEFGHALGLGHSTATEDLMAPTITTSYPYISECDIDAMTGLYNGETSSEVTCQK